MANWLHDNLTVLTMLLGTAALVLLVLWWQTRQRKRAELAIERPTQASRILQWRNRERKIAFLAVAVVVLLAAIWLITLFHETESRKIKEAIDEMRAGVQARDVERIFQHVSKDFRYHAHDRETFKGLSREILRRRDVEDVLIWDFEPEKISREDRTATVVFKAKPKGNWAGSEAFYLCRAEFVLDPDGKWRLKGFKVFNPFVNTNEEISIPGT
jgi:hypothetical protein